MGGITGIEFGPESCVLVRARRRGDAIELSAAHVIEPSVWPAQSTMAAELLKGLRGDLGFPRTARVVAWGLAEGAGARDPATRAVLRPLTAAGFRIESVMSPQGALAILAAGRPRPDGGAAVWMAVNRHGAAIAIVRGTEILFSRAFGWNWEGAAIGSQAQLLQRYSIVAHLAPEVRRGVEFVRTKYGIAVESAVTCGDLPDLRSLTMPLIEELDLEVETLDSAQGLIIPPTARRDRLPDSLSAVRLACAAAGGPLVRGVKLDVVGLARAAAFVVAAGALGWMGYVWWTRPQPAPAFTRGTPAPQRAVQSSAPVPTSTSGVGGTASPNSSRSPISDAPEGDSSPLAPEPARPVAPNPAPPRTTRPSPRVELPQTAGAPAPGARGSRPAQSAPASTDTPRARPRPQPEAAPRQPAPVDRAPQAAARAARADASRPRVARPAPLKDALPVIDTILVSSDRRLAVIDGAFVGVGDVVGARTVVRIEVDAVYLREPSGLEIRVPIRIRREF